MTRVAQPPHRRRERPSRTSSSAPAPGVLAVDDTGRLTHHTEDAARHLDDLAAAAPALTNALTRLLRRHASSRAPAAASSSSSPASRPAVVRARGRSGRWYALHAVVAEPGAWREARAVIVIAPDADAAPAPSPRTPGAPVDRAEEAVALLAARYGLSPRERGVLLCVARGDSTKAAAAALGLSPFTVQDYVKRACDKVGVRTRRELVARIFETS